MKKEKYEDISMTDIIRKSGVSRMGVYNNYKSKDEIMIDIYRETLEDVFFMLGGSVYENLERIFKTAYKNKDAIRTLINAGLAHTFLDMMNARFEKEQDAINAAADKPWEKVSVSFGIAVYDPQNDYSIQDLIRCADRLMYEKKISERSAEAEKRFISFSVNISKATVNLFKNDLI